MTLQEVTMHLVGVAQKKGVETFLADATLYLELFSILTVAWQWIKMANVAEQELNKNEASQTTFLKSNLATMRYFFEYEVPKTLGLVERLKSAEAVTVEASEDLLI
jgi:hypothetical protein